MTGSAMLSWPNEFVKDLPPRYWQCLHSSVGKIMISHKKNTGLCDFAGLPVTSFSTSMLDVDEVETAALLSVSTEIQCPRPGGQDWPGLVKLKEIVQKFLGIAQWSLLRSLELRGIKVQCTVLCSTLLPLSFYWQILNAQCKFESAKSLAKGTPDFPGILPPSSHQTSFPADSGLLSWSALGSFAEHRCQGANREPKGGQKRPTTKLHTWPETSRKQPQQETQETQPTMLTSSKKPSTLREICHSAPEIWVRFSRIPAPPRSTSHHPVAWPKPWSPAITGLHLKLQGFAWDEIRNLSHTYIKYY